MNASPPTPPASDPFPLPATSDGGILPEAASPAAPRPLLGNPVHLLGFFTRLPFGTAGTLDDVTRAFPLVPLIGWLSGVTGAVAALLLGLVLPAPPLAAVLLCLAVGLTGLNQMDGLLDLGDGLMVHGDAERRRAVMHDHAAGVGAVGLTLFTYLLAFAGLTGLAAGAGGGAGEGVGALLSAAGPLRRLAAAVLAAEVLARVPQLVLARWGRASHVGLASVVVEGFTTRHLVVGLLVVAPAAVAGVWVGWLPLTFAAVGAVMVGVVLLRVSNRLLGGIGGDVMGASQEIARAVALVLLTLGAGRWA
jgi:adenosylcobinamide-GDP ribazoletransferase